MLIAFAIFAVLAAGTLGALYSYGRFARRINCERTSALPVDRVETALDERIAPLCAAHPGKSGLALLAGNLDAFAARAVTARNAGRSLDLQYYIWKDDLTGRLLADEIARAADRGVRVRLLLDDINARGLDPVYLALDRHPLIEVRLFNPSRNREGIFARAFELMLRFVSLNRRMHNKAWIADGRVAIVGGRNIGDEYFDAAEASNFQDLDVLALGPVVQQVETAFDAYWNSRVVIPIAALHPKRRRDMASARAKLGASTSQVAARPYIERVTASPGVQDLLAGRFEAHWTGEVELVCDPPAKAQGRKGENWIMNVLAPAAASAREELRIVSPYFVPGEVGVRLLSSIAANGVDVTVLTNSLAATDVAAVHAGYARYRAPIIQAGIRLFELKRVLRKRMRLFGSGAASLHTKAFLVDRRAGFVGSFNLDPRSISLNTEMGLLFADPAIASEMHEIISEQIDADASYRLQLDDGRVRWVDEEETPPRIWTREPEAGITRRVICFVLGLLPIESQL
jgi:putative cardiolipin synthase